MTSDHLRLTRESYDRVAKAYARKCFHELQSAIMKALENAGFGIEDVVEREPYSPDVEYQSRRACLFARTPGQWR